VTPISGVVGANRIARGVSIPHPTGYPELDEGAEKKARLELVKKAVEDLTVEVDEPTVF